jgi:hypothetical protein
VVRCQTRGISTSNPHSVEPLLVVFSQGALGRIEHFIAEARKAMAVPERYIPVLLDHVSVYTAVPNKNN